MNRKTSPCFVSLITLLLVTSCLMAALLRCLDESITLMYRLVSTRVFGVAMATSQCRKTGKKTRVAITVSMIKCGSPWRDWKERKVSGLASERTPHTPSANFPSQMLQWSCLRAPVWCKNPNVEINLPVKGLEVDLLPVGMFSLSSWAFIKHKSFTDSYPCASALPLV